jgi:PKD repeat protein
LRGISAAKAAALLLLTLLPSFTPTRAAINAGFSDWKYQLPIYIVNHNSYEIVNYDAKIVINTKKLISSGMMRADCGDIRFSDGNGKSLPYWIQPNTCGTEETIMWVKIPYLAPNSITVIYMYYGNPKATDESNAYEVFLFFDDFQGTSLNTKRWSIIFEPYSKVQIHYPTFNVNNGLVVNVPYNCYYYVFIPNCTFTAPVVAEMYFRIINCSETSNFITNTILTETNSSAWYFGDYEEFGNYGYWSSTDWGLPVDTNWHLKTMIIEDGNQTSYLDGIPIQWWGRITKNNPTGISIKFKTGVREAWNHIAVEIKFFLIATYSRNVEVLLTPVTNIGKAPVITLYNPQVSSLTVTINGNVTPGYSGASISRVHWDWGDGFSEDHSFPASHTYSKPGTYTVTVTVYQSDGLTTSKTVTVTVEAPSFDFSVSTRGTSFSIMQGGGSITVPVSVSLIEGTPSSVSLSLFDWMSEEGKSLGSENLWFTAEFNPSSGIPPFDSTLTIKVAKEVPPGIYKADIVAYHDGIPKHTTITVNVTPALEIISYGYWIIQTEAEQYQPQPAIPEGIAAPSTLPIETYSRAIRPPAQGEDFLVSMVVKNRGNFDIIIPGSLSTTIVLPPDPSKYGVTIDDPQLVEATQLDENTVAVSGTRSSITLKPGETTTIFYRCKAQWHFIPEQEVPFDTAKINKEASIDATIDEISGRLFKREASGLWDMYILIFEDLPQTYQKLQELNIVIAPALHFHLSFPIDITNQEIPAVVLAKKQKIDTFDTYFHLRAPIAAFSVDAGMIVGTAVGSAVGPEGSILGAWAGAIAGAVVSEGINFATDSIVLSYLYNDPSLNYTRLVPAPSVPGAFYKLPNSTEYKVLLYEYLYLAYLNASAESMARANGAREMNDTKYYYLQLRNAQVYAANASRYYGKLAPLLEQIVEELYRSGYLNESSFRRGREYIAKYGLPSNVTRLLTELGFTKYINIHEVEERLKSAEYVPVNVTAFKEALELSLEYNPAAFFNRSFAEELESLSNRTLCQVLLGAEGAGNTTIKVDGREYPLPASLYLNLGTRHNLTFAQVVPGLFQDYVFKELHLGNQTYTDPSIQLTVLEPVSVTAIYEARPSTLAIAIIALALLAAIAAAYTLRRKHAAKPLPPPPPPS